MRSFLHPICGALFGVRHALRVTSFIILNLAHGERVGLEEFRDGDGGRLGLAVPYVRVGEAA